MSALTTIAISVLFAVSASAHGHIAGIVASNTFYTGYFPRFQFANPPPEIPAWSLPSDWDSGFVSPDNYTHPDIICHIDPSPGGSSVKVAAGDIVELQWTRWPDGHKGPVLDYLAKCPGSCSEVDRNSLRFFKIGEAGLIDNSARPYVWGSDQLIANNNSWTVTIPKDIAPGNYVLRNEIIALHVAGDVGGAQNYPQCVNLEITGDGTEEPPSTPATEFYSPNDPGIHIFIYTAIDSYTIPGPTLYKGAVSMAQTQLAIATMAPTSYGAFKTTPGMTFVPSQATVSASQTSSTTLDAVQGSATSTASNDASSATPATDAEPTPSSSDASVTTDGCTHTIHTTVTAVQTATVTEAPDPNSQVANIASAVPSDSLSFTYDPVAPSSSATPNDHSAAAYHWGDQPTKPLPEGYTLKDLLEWVAYLVSKSWNEGTRVHQRDFRSFVAAIF